MWLVGEVIVKLIVLFIMVFVGFEMLMVGGMEGVFGVELLFELEFLYVVSNDNDVIINVSLGKWCVILIFW